MLVLGISAGAMLYATHRIGELHVVHYAPIERAAAELRLALATAHLWLEEYLTGDPQVDLDADVYAALARADALARALLDGGTVGEARQIATPLREPELRRCASKILVGLDRFRILTSTRLKSTSGVGTRLDERHDDTFRDLLREVGALERGIQARVLASRRRAKQLFWAILFFWVLLLVVTLVTLQKRARRQRQTEAALRHSEDQLRQAQKLEAVGRLAGGLAHDINNYLATINSQAGLVKILHGEVPGVGALMDEIIGTVGRTTSLIQRLLAFSRSQPSRPVVLDLAALAEELATMVRRLLGDDVTLVIRSGAEVWPVEADRSQVEQVLVNLLVNASESMPGGGRVTVSIENVTRPGSLRPEGPPAGDFVCLGVSDDGEGVAPEIRDKIFDPFFSTKSQAGGTVQAHSGLGLATVYGIVHQAGGRVEVESEPGRGSTFRVLLPRTHGRPEPLDTLESEVRGGRPPAAGHGAGRRILVVEDNPELRNTTVAVLAALGHEVASAADGLEGIGRVRDADPAFDVVITDLVMPEASGRELAEAVLATSGAGVILTSGFCDRIPVCDLLASERVRFLDKPFTPSDLLGAIADLMADRSRPSVRGGR